MEGMTVLNRTRLEHRFGGHSKFYEVLLTQHKVGDGFRYVVTGVWGKIGCKNPRTAIKYGPTRMQSFAFSKYLKVLRDKKGNGYTEVETAATRYVADDIPF